MSQDLLEQLRPYLDGRDIITALVAAFILFLANMLRRWVMARRNKLAATFTIIVLSSLVVLAVWKYAVIMGAVVAVFTFKVNIWILVGAYALLTILVAPWFLKNIHKIAAQVGGAHNIVFIRDGKPLLEKPFDWEARSDPSNHAHGAFKVIQLNGGEFYGLECTIAYSPIDVPKLSVGIFLSGKPVGLLPDLRKMATTDIYSGVDLFAEGLKARIVEGGAKRALRKEVALKKSGEGAELCSVRLQFIVNDSCNLALLVDGRYMFAKPIHQEALRHLALFVHTQPNHTFSATVKGINVQVTKTEFDLLMERRPQLPG